MAFVVKDRVKQSTTTTGTGSIVLNGTVSGFQTFANALSDGDTTYYAIFEVSTNEWEVGVGTWTESTTTLARTTVLASSNSNSAIDLSAQAEVFITQPAGKAAFFDPSGDLTLVQDPTSNLQAATKQYVDTIAAAGLHYHDPVRVEQEGNLSATYSNGTAGVGATLTNNSTQAALTIDGVALSLNDRVLIYEQTNGYENGIYTVTNVGSASTNWVLTRATDADSYAPSDPDSLGQGDAFFVLEGDAGAGELYVMNTQGTITFGTTNITFTQVASTAVYSAGTGLTLTGTEFAADGANISNVDAVTLDGIDSSQFLRSDTVDTKTAGNLNFSDSVKAQFGTGNDLQIYHDGSNSEIINTSSGHFLLGSASRIILAKNPFEYMANFQSDGAATLYYDNVAKFATTSTGVDITGTLTSDGLTFDQVLANPTDSTATIYNQSGVGPTLSGYKNEFRTGTTPVSRMEISNNGDISFYEDTGTNVNFFWDASTMALGIGTGTTTPTNPITIQQTSVHWPYIALTNSSGVTKSQFGYQVNDDLLDIVANSGGIKFRTNNTETMRLTSAGNLLVGKSSSDSGGTEGLEFLAAGPRLYMIRDGGTPMEVGRLSSDGEIINFSKDGSTVGSIATWGGDPVIMAAANYGLKLYDSTSIDDIVHPVNTSGSAYDNQVSLGYSGSRFKDLYLSGVMKTGTNQRTSFGTAGFWDNATDGNNVGVRLGGAHMYLSDGNGSVTNKTRDIGRYDRRIRTLYAGSTLDVEHDADNSGVKTTLKALHISNNTIEIHQFGQSHANAPAVNQIGVSNAEQHLHLVTDDSATVDAGTSTKGIFLRSGGNVGIGTQSPNTALEVKRTSGTATIRVHADHTSTPRAAIEFMRGTTDTFGGDAYTDWKLGQVGSTQADFAIISHDTTRGANERLTLEYDTGNVGIGITTPDEKLDVNGDTRIRGSGSTMAGATMANASLLIGSTTSGMGIDSNEIMTAGDDLHIGGLTGGVRFRVGSTQHGIMDSSGNFGFGTTGPTQKVHVQGGQLRVSNGSDFYINSTSSNSYAYTSSTPFDIYTAGNFRMRVGSTGDVSIGNNAAFTIGGSAKLTVLGASGTVYLAAGSANGDQFYLRKNGSVTGMYEWQTYYSSNNAGTIQLQPYGGSVTIGGSNATTTKQLEVFGDIGSTGLTVVPTTSSGGAYFGNATQTGYMNLIITSNSGNAQIWKSGTGYTSYGGASALNIYNSNANIAFFSNGRTTADMNITNGNVSVAGTLSATTKSFVIDHPTKDGMKLRHGSLEGPEDGVYVRGRLTGETVIELPDYWTGLVHENSITVQLTAMGGKADLWVENIADNKVTVGCDTEVDCFYFVQATRKDVDAWDVEYVADS